MTAFMGFPQDGHAFSAAEVGQALAGLVVRESTGLPRTGMLGAGPTVTAVPASWKVQVGPFVYVHQVTGAVQFSGLSTAEQIDISPGAIPAGQARIDVVCWDPLAANLTVIAGTPATSPSVPAVGGLAPVAKVRVNAGDGIVVGSQVEPSFARTTLAGSPLHSVTPLDSTAAPVTPDQLLMKSGRHTGVTDSVGRLNVPFPEPFPAGLVSAQQIVGHQSAQGLLVFNATNRSQAQFFFPGAAGVTRTVCWVAWGY